jgi:cysteinyl-tRNA synthetase
MNSKLKVYNSYSNSLEEFIPTQDSYVTIYVCGPTVYDHAHMGHARSAIVFDFIRRSLEFFGYTVFFVSNYTDIDDKMINRANEKKITVSELAEEIIRSYEEDMIELIVQQPTVRPKATDHITEMISIVEKLIEKEFAYIVKSGVYFRVHKFKKYGKLANLKIEEMISQDEENEVITEKENQADFALMKASKKGEPSWDTPWGKMRPGWHIECSAMAKKYLGNSFDIHGGGQDLLFPHHENEIAQSEAAFNKKFANYWIHNGFLTVNKEKMSKSLSNFFTVKDILKKGYDGLTIRLFVLSAHYRKPLEFSEEELINSKKKLQRIKTAKENLEEIFKRQGSLDQSKELDKLTKKFFEYESEFKSSLLNDFNTPDAIAALFKLIREINKFCNMKIDIKGKHVHYHYRQFNNMLEVLGLSSEISFVEAPDTDNLMSIILELREKARNIKDYQTSDFIRDKLKLHGFVLVDSKSGTNWKRV